jgi:hypothetical protein
MAIIPGRYRGYGVRPPHPGSAGHMVDPIPEGWKITYTRAERALAEPFRGVTTDGQVVPGLFSLQQTGISTKPIKDTADAFIASLTAAQQKVPPIPLTRRSGTSGPTGSNIRCATACRSTR